MNDISDVQNEALEIQTSHGSPLSGLAGLIHDLARIVEAQSLQIESLKARIDQAGLPE